MKISLYLSSSKYWWAYLAIRSNPEIFTPQGLASLSQAIFFDDLANLPAKANTAGTSARFYYICWDGVSAESAIDKATELLGERLTVLVVGDSTFAPPEPFLVRDLYPKGELHFTGPSHRFDAWSTAILGTCRLKAILMPLKNLLGNNLASGLKLLLGRKKIVFCGSYGTIPKVIAELCKRHSVDPHLFDEYKFYGDAPCPSFETYLEYLHGNGQFLAHLYDHGKINGKFLHSAVHLLGREYFMEKIRSAGLRLFAHGYAAGTNINVYSTPFYSQHVFLDFGSAVGGGNYPRLADLRYFKKKVIQLNIDSDLDTTAESARNGTLDLQFEQEWELKSPRLIEAMR